MHHLAGTPHLADDLPPGVIGTTVACPGRSSLVTVFSAKKNVPKTSEHDKAQQILTAALPLSISQMSSD
jgi:hypothetical protein